MGFFLRKSINLGPFRINLSKNGVGVSVGVPGLRYTVGQRGTMVTASLPGTGLGYRTSPMKKSQAQGNDIPDAKTLLNERRLVLESEIQNLHEQKNGLEKSIEAELPRLKAGRRLQLAWLNFQANEFEKALQELACIDWQHPDIEMCRSMMLAKLGREKEALSSLESIAQRTESLGTFATEFCGLIVYGVIDSGNTNSVESMQYFACDAQGYQLFDSWLRRAQEKSVPIIEKASPGPQVRSTHGKQFADLCVTLMVLVLFADKRVEERELNHLQNMLASDKRFARYENRSLLDLCHAHMGKSISLEMESLINIVKKMPVDLLSAADKAEAMQLAFGMAQSDRKITESEAEVICQIATMLGASLPMGFEGM